MTASGLGKATSAIALVEAAYDLSLPRQAWLQRLVDEIHKTLNVGFGALGVTFEVSPGKVQTTSSVASSERSLEAAHEHIVSTFVPALERDVIAVTFGSDRIYTSISDCLAPLGLAPQTWDTWASIRALTGSSDFLAIKAADPTGQGVLLGAPQPRSCSAHPGLEGSWARLMVHVLASMRLRLGSDHRADLDAAEAILDPAGRCLHAADSARPARARDALRDAAKRIDRARSLARSDPEEALALWQGLVDGQWSLVDHFDTDGRRYLIVRRNAPDVVDPRVLDGRERAIASHLLLGHSGKYIAYALGLAESTASSCMHVLQRKLGARSRAELVLTLRALQRSKGEEGDDPTRRKPHQ